MIHFSYFIVSVLIISLSQRREVRCFVISDIFGIRGLVDSYTVDSELKEPSRLALPAEVDTDLGGYAYSVLVAI